MSNKITKDVYLAYAKKIVSVLDGEAFYEQFKKRVDGGASNYKLQKKRLIQDISLDWIETIEDALPSLDNIVRNPRKFIVQEEDIVDISLAKSISTESVKHLAQHTNMISKVDKDGTVTPNRILNITKEESFEIYENRFIYTLLLRLKDFVTMRYDKIKKASATQDILELDLESRFNLPSKKITYRTEFFAQLSFDEVMQLEPETLTKIERIAKIDRIITDFLSSSFAKAMRNSAPVRPPITRTNVILKNPDFKKALTIWQFVETYKVTGGFKTSDDIEPYEVDEKSAQQLKEMVALNTMLFESLYDQHETDFDMEDKNFEEFTRTGEMDFKSDKLDRDKFSQKLDEQELDKDEDKTEDVAPKESDDMPPEKDDIQDEDGGMQDGGDDKQDIQDEKTVEKEKPTNEDDKLETPSKEEAFDAEPDAEAFDRSLFDVRKIYKRPAGDRLKQEETIKVKDAIDRCLLAYRKIKQDEIDEAQRDRLRRIRREEMQKRAEAFRKQRNAISKQIKNGESMYFGIDPFQNQAVKIEPVTKLEEDNTAEFFKVHKELYYNKHERLDFEDKDLDKIKHSIAEMEIEKAEREKKNAQEDAKLKELEKIASTAASDIIEKVSEEFIKEAKSKKKKEKEKAHKEKVSTKIKTFGHSEITQNSDVGDLPIELFNANDMLSTSYFGSNKAKIVVDKRKNVEESAPIVAKAKPAKVKATSTRTLKTNKLKVDVEIGKTVAENKDEFVEFIEQVIKSDVQGKKKKKATPKNAISPTTANQKYSKASGKSKNIEKIDLDSVSVGKINIENNVFGSKSDPFGGNSSFGKSDPFGSGKSDPFGSGKSDPFGSGKSDPFGSNDPFGGSSDPFAQIYGVKKKQPKKKKSEVEDKNE